MRLASAKCVRQAMSTERFWETRRASRISGQTWTRGKTNVNRISCWQTRCHFFPFPRLGSLSDSLLHLFCFAAISQITLLASAFYEKSKAQDSRTAGSHLMEAKINYVDRRAGGQEDEARTTRWETKMLKNEPRVEAEHGAHEERDL